MNEQLQADSQAAPRALEGVKVLDLSRVLAGPWSTQILADFGADVFKVEQPGKGDDTRGWGPPFLKLPDGSDDPRESAYYLCANRNKRSAAIDIAAPEGAELIRRLAAEADVLVENFKTGGLAKYGLDYASIRAINPAIVYCSITGFGQDGPYAARGGYDFLAQGMGGLMSVTGEADGPPLKVGVAMADLATGMYATVSILAALRHAERTGEGQQIDISLLDTQIAMLANQASSYLVGGVVPGRMGNRHPTVVPYTTFAVTDGTVIIAIGNDSQFRAFCEEMGVAELGSDPRFATASARVINRDAIEEIMRGLVRDQTRDGLIARLEAAGVPVGPVNTVEDVFADPFVEARHTVHRFTRADGVEIPSVAYPGKLSATPADYRYHPPKVGEQTRELLGEWLGLDKAALDALETRGVVKQG
ncbi:MULTISPECIES: CaiB/BaiF CoA-transferase family protein [unclassified Novosphingobium]|uniref:CaiB/BaiF CoA transferase family protein n=1 Tax=unclassified Novosphingobium TaxID=2644732 RepID=UPI000EE8E081|nr:MULTISPECIES: CaiB/BaiF CoA-transferase family protein [unclassified Novosphingobium]HCF24316.1 CoA transferase [Novosphingobium sp.]HQV04401.1 CaiB/BaiF CoA-transferase family protein [Novosphingobium sp.]